jgi:cyclohexadienyl dehydratase
MNIPASSRLVAVATVIALFAVLMLGQAVPAQAAPADESRLDDILARGYILVGTTGDYKPFSFYDKAANDYVGYDIDAARMLGEALGVEVVFVHTTWPTLMQDLLDDKFDIAMSGITRTYARQKVAHLSHGYFPFGKSPLIRAADKAKYISLEAIDQPGVKIGVNPGGTNERFVKANIKKATIIVHPKNAEIPGMVANGTFDVMITDSPEAIRYAKDDARLYAALLDNTFTKNQFGILMQRGDQVFANFINMWMEEMKLQGQFDKLYDKHMK